MCSTFYATVRVARNDRSQVFFLTDGLTVQGLSSLRLVRSYNSSVQHEVGVMIVQKLAIYDLRFGMHNEEPFAHLLLYKILNNRIGG